MNNDLSHKLLIYLTTFNHQIWL